MKKIFLLSLCIHAFAFCDIELLVEENLDFGVVVNQVQENFLQEILQGYPDLKVWYGQASHDEKTKLHKWSARLVDASINVIRKSDDEFIKLLEDFEEITQLTNMKLVTEIDVTLQPTDTENIENDGEANAVVNTKSQTEQTPELTQEIIEQMSPVKMWYESATEGEKKQFDNLLAKLFSYINEITHNADEEKMRDLAGAIRILTGLQDLQFTLSVQMSINQKS